MDDTVLTTAGHGDQLFTQLYQFYQDGQLCDYSLLGKGGRIIEVHRCVLAAASPLFAHTLSQPNSQHDTEYDVSSLDHESVLCVLEYLYTGRLHIQSDKIWLVLAAASKLEITEAVSLCQKHMTQVITRSKTKKKVKSDEQQILQEFKIKSEPITDDIIDSLVGIEYSINTDRDSHEYENLESSRSQDVDRHADIESRVSRRSRRSKREISTSPSKSRKKRKLHSSKSDEEEKLNGEIAEPSQSQNGVISATWNGSHQEPTQRKQKKSKLEKLVETFRDNFGLPKRKCDYCPYQFFHYSALKLHLRKHSPAWMKARKLAYQTHLRHLQVFSDENKSQRKYGCKVCGTKFGLYSYYLQHYGKFHQLHLFCQMCKNGEQNRFNKRLLTIHNQFHHFSKNSAVNGSRHQCLYCSRVFLHQKLLDRHIQLNHRDMKMPEPRQCRHCNKTFLSDIKYITHLTGHGLHDRDLHLELTNPSEVPIYQKYPDIPPCDDPDDPFPYKCPKCDASYTKKLALNLHMTKMHGIRIIIRKSKMTIKQQVESLTLKRHSCEECQMSFIEASELNQHQKDQHPHVKYHCKIPECTYKSKSKNHFEKHVKQHDAAVKKETDDKPSKVCHICNKVFEKPYRLRIHLVFKHNIPDPGIRLWECSKEGCQYKTHQRGILLKHEQRHNFVKDKECDMCGKMFKTEKNLEKHKNKLHFNIRPWICDVCGAAYGEESELKTHMNRHTEKKFQCDQCDYACHDKGNYQSHMFSKHKVKIHSKQKEFKCTECDYTCDRKTRLTDHMACHLDLRPHQCEHCGAAFRNKNTLKTHRLYLHSERNLKCDYCDYATSVLNHLREHVRVQHTHRDIKPYKCAYCDYHAAVSGNARKHVAQVHKGLPIKWVKVCDKYPNNSRPVMSVENKGAPGTENPVIVPDNMPPPAPQPHQPPLSPDHHDVIYTPPTVVYTGKSGRPRTSYVKDNEDRYATITSITKAERGSNQAQVSSTLQQLVLSNSSINHLNQSSHHQVMNHSAIQQPVLSSTNPSTTIHSSVDQMVLSTSNQLLISSTQQPLVQSSTQQLIFSTTQPILSSSTQQLDLLNSSIQQLVPSSNNLVSTAVVTDQQYDIYNQEMVEIEGEQPMLPQSQSDNTVGENVHSDLQSAPLNMWTVQQQDIM